ncbi:agouti-related protein [Amia ocellicauda]|uniref:agouti-related protein n=1 Tax=Amia ocellicauda TaxID=2972642 RepID=UPI00346408A9
MWSSMLLCWWVLAAGSVQGSARVEDASTSASGTGRYTLPGLLRAVTGTTLSGAGDGALSRLAPERLVSDSQEELFLEDTGLFDGEVLEAVELQSRAVRSPRRCYRAHESCLGHQLPCCDPCDTCYCRFFNAFCYCRRISSACPHGR